MEINKCFLKVYEGKQMDFLNFIYYLFIVCGVERQWVCLSHSPHVKVRGSEAQALTFHQVGVRLEPRPSSRAASSFSC